MAAITYNTPVDDHPIEGVMLRYMVIDRLKPCPSVRFVFVEGYYTRDSEGSQVLNSLGYPMWTEKGRTWEREIPMNDEKIIELLIRHQVDFASLDDKFMDVANDYFNEVINV